MQFKLFMGLEIILWKWLTKTKHVFSIGFSFLIDTLSNRLHLSSMINIKPSVMITKKSHPWRKLTFNMLPFGRGGTHLELPTRVLFKSSTIGSTSSTFMCEIGKVSCWISSSKLFYWNFIFHLSCLNFNFIPFMCL
jgi:hypothetical protein